MATIRHIGRKVSENLKHGDRQEVLPMWAPKDPSSSSRWFKATMRLVTCLLCIVAAKQLGTCMLAMEPAATELSFDPVLARALHAEAPADSQHPRLVQTELSLAPSSPLPEAPREVTPAAEPERELLLEDRPGRVAASNGAAAVADQPQDALVRDALTAKAYANAAAQSRVSAAAVQKRHKITTEESRGRDAAIRRAAAGANHLGSAQGRASLGDSGELVDVASSHGRLSPMPCTDRHSSCKHWAEAGECTANRHYMHNHCAESCGFCYIGTHTARTGKRR